MKQPLQGVKGAPDIVPPTSWHHEHIVDTATALFRRYGFAPISTPPFEPIELFVRSLDEESDIVTKEMYTFEDKGGRQLALRPDMTAPVVRAALQHSLHRESPVQKLYYTATVFRHEKPQAGRYRVFAQVGVEALGVEGPDVDAEVIELAAAVFREVGVDAQLHLNSIGHIAGGDPCRGSYLDLLRGFLESHRDDLCPDCRRKINRNPLRTFDCKVPADREIMSSAPLVTDHLCAGCKGHFDELKGLLTHLGVEFIEEPRLVRGLDYYTRTAFEFVSAGLGSQDAVGSGGRYDGLAESLGGPRLPGVGFGLGVGRMALAAVSHWTERDATRAGAYVVAIGETAGRVALDLATQLRRAGLQCDLDYSKRSLKGQMRAADRAGARWVVMVGERELESGVVKVKEMETGVEVEVPVSAVAERLVERPT